MDRRTDGHTTTANTALAQHLAVTKSLTTTPPLARYMIEYVNGPLTLKVGLCGVGGILGD